MARPRSFDTDRALDDVRNAFWSHGIAATSISDLCTATGPTTGSLRKAFVDKPTLVRRVLDEYLDAGAAWVSAWPVAFPTVLVVAPLVRRLVARAVRAPERAPDASERPAEDASQMPAPAPRGSSATLAEERS